MQLDYTFYYVEANIVCIIIFGMMLIREMGSVGRQTKQVIFVNITISHMLYFISDIAWVLILADIIPYTRFSAAAANFTNALLLCAITGLWFVYVELSQGEQYITSFKTRMLTLLPAMVNPAVILALLLIAPDTIIDENKELTNLFYILFLAVPAIYICISAVRSAVRAFRKENYAVRTQYLVCAIYPVILTVFGIWQTLWLAAPIFCFGCAIMMLYVYIISLNDQVSIDELTRLNNRTQLKKFVASEALRQNTDRLTHYVLMIDLNKFKQINDQYGHVEGDNALKRTADALKISCADNPYKTFIARYGGDEFIIIAKTDKEELIQELCSNIKSTLIRLNDEAGAKYELTACIGYANYNGELDGFQTALARADEALYKEKAERGSLR
ncbi:MAG: GGDEF domain-containing protein [Clostridiales bacterium]|nr:GGDEF domain-containing protein [Clostridiales bacterium]